MGQRKQPLKKFTLKRRLAQQRDERSDLAAIGASKPAMDALMFRHWAELDGESASATVPEWAFPSAMACTTGCPPCCPNCGQGHGEDTPSCPACE